MNPEDTCPNLGSSPHARGAHVHAAVAVGPVRLIPACAGSTSASYAVRGGRPAHPRMRGEHRQYGTQHIVRTGSSPHARGAPVGGDLVGVHEGLIPACAGSTHREAGMGRDSRAHPRMRGEHHRADHRARDPRGSSPHARGARAGKTLSVLSARLIPACAGSTPSGAAARRAVRAHPRMRGEHTS